MKRGKKILALCLTMLMVLTNVLTVYADFSDVKNHWAADIINKWAEKGIVNGSNGLFRPNDSISRAEFFTIIVRIFNYIDKSEKQFPDVKPGDWYEEAVAKAYEAEIVNGDNLGRINPNAPISRQEAAAVIQRAFKLAAVNADAYTGFNDAAQIADYAKEAVSAMKERGYIAGRPGNLFAPRDNLTRAEAVKIIGAAAGDLKNAAGTYTGDITGNLVVNTGDVTLKDMTIQGNLYLTQGIGSGDVKLENVAVNGDIVAVGGGENSIVLTDTTLTGMLVVEKKDGKIRIVAAGTTSIPDTRLNSGAKLEGKGFGSVQVLEVIEPGQAITLDGDFDEIIIDVPGVIMQITDGTVKKLNITKNAAGSVVHLAEGAVIDKLTADGSVNVTGSGNIIQAIIGAEGVTLEKAPEKLTLTSGVKSVMVAGKEITNGSASGDSGNTDGSGNSGGTPTASPPPSTQPTATPSPSTQPTATPTPSEEPAPTPDPTEEPSDNTEIKVKNGQEEVVTGITGNAVTVAPGTTAGALKAAIESTDGSSQVYSVLTGANGTTVSNTTVLVSGYVLKVRAESGAEAMYTISVSGLTETSIVVKEGHGVIVTAIGANSVDVAYGVTVDGLKAAIKSASGSIQSYKVLSSAGGEEITDGMTVLSAGNVLKVTSGSYNRIYAINVDEAERIEIEGAIVYNSDLLLKPVSASAGSTKEGYDAESVINNAGMYGFAGPYDHHDVGVDRSAFEYDDPFDPSYQPFDPNNPKRTAPAVSMWLSGPDGENWFQIDLGAIYPLGKMLVWNYNATGETNNGIRDAEIFYSVDGINWESNGKERFAQAIGSPLQKAANLASPVDFGGKPARYVKIVPDSETGTGNWGGESFGLSEIRVYRYANHVTEAGQLIAVANVTAGSHMNDTFWGFYSPEINVVNNYGMSGTGGKEDVHGTDYRTMWLSKDDANNAPDKDTNNWITFDLGGTYPIGQMLVWNYNEPGQTTRGIKNATVEYSLDGTHFTRLGVYEFAQASGEESGPTNLSDGGVVDFEGRQARYVRITPNPNLGNGNWGGTFVNGGPVFGLSEVRFYSAPGTIIEPAPDWTGLFMTFPQMGEAPGWNGSDGIYTWNVNGIDVQGNANADTKSLFVFGDTMISRVDPVTKIRTWDGFPRNTYAELTGDIPDPANIRFRWGSKGDNTDAGTTVRPATPASHIGQVAAHVTDGSGLIEGADTKEAEHVNTNTISYPDPWDTGNPPRMLTSPLTSMWLTEENPEENWIMFDLGKAYALGDMLVWNYNFKDSENPEIPYWNRGIRNARILYSTDNVTWNVLYENYEFDRAEGKADQKATSIIDFEGRQARYIKIDPANEAGVGNWGGIDGNEKIFGLSEVRFYTEDDEILRYARATAASEQKFILTPDQVRAFVAQSNDDDIETEEDVKKYIEENNGIYPGQEQWYADGVVIGDKIYLMQYAVDGSMYIQRDVLVEIPINPDGTYNFDEVEQYDLPTFYFGERDHSRVFFLQNGVLANTVEAGAPNPDGYIYIYGIKQDGSSAPYNLRHIIVGRILPDDLVNHRFNELRYYAGSSNGEEIWSTDIRDAAGILFKGEEEYLYSSVECGASMMVGGYYDGKFLFITNEQWTANVMVAPGDNPWGPFVVEHEFHNTIPGYLMAYNAKGHPHLSKPGELLMSVNYNAAWWEADQLGILLGYADSYAPRFSVMRHITGTNNETGIKVKPGKEHVVTRIAGGTIEVTIGTTLNDLLAAIQARDGSNQTYRLYDEVDGIEITDGETVLVAGNALKVTAEDGITAGWYEIAMTTLPNTGFIAGVTATEGSDLDFFGFRLWKGINTVNNSGMSSSTGSRADTCDNQNLNMWLTSADSDDSNNWIRFDLGSVYSLDEMVVWNYNEAGESDRGIRNATVEYSIDGINWALLGIYEFNRASGEADQAATDTIDFGGVRARYVRINPVDDPMVEGDQSNWGDVDLLGNPLYGLSEVRFYASASAEASSNTGIMVKAGSEDVVTAINGDTINVAFGTTAAGLTDAIIAADLSAQSYTVCDALYGSPVPDETVLATGYGLKVTAEDGVTEGWYTVSVNEEIVYSGITSIIVKEGCEDVVTAVYGDTNIINVAFGTTASMLVNSILASDGSEQSYSVCDAVYGVPVAGNAVLVDGNALKVIAEDGETTGWYIIEVDPVQGGMLISGVTAIAGSHNTVWGLIYPAENTVNNSGMTGDTHDNVWSNMWLSQDDNDDTNNWIMFDLGIVYPLGEMHVWNFNELGGVVPQTARGIKNATVEYSVNGTDWYYLGGEGHVYTFAKADASPALSATTIIDFDGIEARYVRIVPDPRINIGNWGGTFVNGGPVFGLSEVRFYTKR